jgi:hypothetical protein
MNRAPLLAALLLTSTACVQEEGPMMEPGSDCLECHGGGEASQAWTVAGTSIWGGQGSKVQIRDAAGKSFSREVNKAGNFWTSEPVAFPLTVSVNGQAMGQPVTDGSCNRCHGSGGGGGGN